MIESSGPAITGLHHLSFTVTDIEASLAWYQRVFGWERGDAKFPHVDCEKTGYGVLLTDHRSGLVVGLHVNSANEGERFDEARTGLDHASFNVSARSDLPVWTAWLDELGIPHTGIRDLTEPFVYSTVVFRDPDNIQLELIAFG